MKSILCITLAMFFAKSSFSQDSALLLFNKDTIILPDSIKIKTEVVRNDRFRETIIWIDQDKYFYIRHDLEDTTAVEFGQLERYRFRDGFYLLRRGLWVLENENEKVEYSNFGKLGLKEEIRVSLEPAMFYMPENNHSKKRKTKVRSSQ